MSLPDPALLPGPLGPPATMQVPKFDNTLGALLVGGLVAMALWGITCMQTYTYFTHGSKDPLRFKLMIAFLWILDTFDSALNGHILYFYMVSNYLNPLAMMTVVWSVIIHVAITSISNFIIRSMFAHRVYRLSDGNIILTLWIMAISMTDLVCGIVITAKAFRLSSFADLDTLSTLMYLIFSAGTLSDLSVALALCFLLWKSRTGFKKTNSLISVLMLYTVNTGLIVAIDAALGMITYAVMPHNFIFLAFYLLLSKLYLNSYLASLNARGSLRGKVDDPVSIHLSQISTRTGADSQPRWRRYGPELSLGDDIEKSRAETMAISVQTLVDRKVDGDDKGVSPSNSSSGRAY